MSSKLLDAYRSGQECAADELVRTHLGLVRRVVGRLAIQLPPQVDREDLEEIGLLGLLNAARTFDPERGASFQTFAYVAIRGAVLDELRRLDVLPRTRRDGVRAYDRARRELSASLGREPTFLEIQQHLGLSAEELHEVLRARALAQSEAAGTGESSTGISPESFAEHGTSDPAQVAQLNEAKERLADAMETLPEREQEVLILYYQGGLLLREIGQVMGITESRVSQILNHALVLLNHRLRGGEEGEER